METTIWNTTAGNNFRSPSKWYLPSGQLHLDLQFPGCASHPDGIHHLEEQVHIRNYSASHPHWKYDGNSCAKLGIAMAARLLTVGPRGRLVLDLGAIVPKRTKIAKRPGP